jgi:hypothetical protein
MAGWVDELSGTEFESLQGQLTYRKRGIGCRPTVELSYGIGSATPFPIELYTLFFVVNQLDYNNWILRSLNSVGPGRNQSLTIMPDEMELKVTAPFVTHITQVDLTEAVPQNTDLILAYRLGTKGVPEGRASLQCWKNKVEVQGQEVSHQVEPGLLLAGLLQLFDFQDGPVRLSEFIFYPSALTLEEVNNVNDFLSRKYGIE